MSIAFVPHLFHILACEVYVYAHLHAVVQLRVDGALQTVVSHGGKLQGQRPHVVGGRVAGYHRVVVHPLVEVEEGLTVGLLNLRFLQIFGRVVQLPVYLAVHRVVLVRATDEAAGYQ